MATIKQIKKRNGSIATFDQNKITEAIWKAAQSVGGTNKELAENIAIQVVTVLEVFFKDPANVPTVEQIQDLVEKILIEKGHAKTAKAYILYRHKRQEVREKTIGFTKKSAEILPPPIQIAEKASISKNAQLTELTQAIKEAETHLATLKKLQEVWLRNDTTPKAEGEKTQDRNIDKPEEEKKKSAVLVSLPPIKAFKAADANTQLSFTFEKKNKKNSEEVLLPPIAVPSA